AYRTGWRTGTFRSLVRVPATERQTASVAAPALAPAPRRAQPTLTGSSSTPDGVKPLLAHALRLWGVTDELSEPAMAAWPAGPDGGLDVSAVTGRYQLAATLLPQTDVAELQAVDLPAIVELRDGGPRLLRRIDGSLGVLLSPRGDETRLSLDELESSWTRSALIVWRNVDLLPANPHEVSNPIVVSTVGLRLQKLGFINPPIPSSNDDRFQEAVRRFQRSIGLTADGIVGPRTTLALSRVIAGRFGPTLSAATSSR